MREEYQKVCEDEAKFRIELINPNLPKEKKDKAISEMKTRLVNMYDDIFEANTMNEIALDTLVSLS